MYEPNKDLGQNFLIESIPVSEMLGALELKTNDTIVEVGPGLGILTESLTIEFQRKDFPYKIYAVEIDPRFTAKLEQMFVMDPNTLIVESDILEWLPTFKPETSYKLLGSLPFYITSPIMHAIIQAPVMPEIAVVLVQKEVGRKISDNAPQSSYLAAYTQTFYNVEYLGDVSRNNFDPKPEVDGGILKLVVRKDVPELTLELKKSFSRFIHRGFQHPRKKLNKVYSKEEAGRFDLDLNLRAQEVPVDKWLTMFLTEKGLR